MTWRRYREEADRLPAGAVLDRVADALGTTGSAVLAAPPGAGKTTLVPLRLLLADWRGDGRIVLLEPRRLAARSAARRMAELLGEEVGATVGYRMRLDSRVTAQTRIEVVTEGVFVRMIQDDPELSGIAAIVFDEFHERALDADFGLALALDVKAGLRDDLRLLVMSATLDVGAVSNLLGDAPVIESRGRAWPVDLRHDPRAPGEKIEDKMAATLRRVVAEETGSVLAFLPGQAEIRRTMERLEGRLPADVDLAPLYGMMEGGDQDRAIRPAPAGRRKIVLATAIAETSITIDGVRIVVDSGLQRLPHFEPATGITRLETVRVSRASAEQRAGRAGRTEPGTAIRLWREEQTAALPAFSPPEILASDLSGLVLDCAAWGVGDPRSLAFIEPPPQAALNEARGLLSDLGALDTAGSLTETGRAMRALGLPARLAAMLVKVPRDERPLGGELAVLLSEAGLGGNSPDLNERLYGFRRDRSDRAGRASDLARRLGGRRAAPPDAFAAGDVLLHAFPDRLAMNRGGQGRYLMVNGRGAELAPETALAAEKFLVIADMTGRAGAHRILAAAPVSPRTVEAMVIERGADDIDCAFDAESRSVRARRIRRIGAIILEETPVPLPDTVAVADALAEGVRRLGVEALCWPKEVAQLRGRLSFLHRSLGTPWPDVSTKALESRLDEWFVPFQTGVRSFGAVRADGLKNGLMALVPYELHRALDELAPTHFQVPTGSRIAIRYDGEEPVLAVRVQELFGMAVHPAIAGGRQSLLLELLSPAHRPVQTTRDLPGFWHGSWADVRAEMRGRYPKHPWPEDPAGAEPTRRVKPR